MGLSGKFHYKFCCISVIACDKCYQFALAVFDNCLNAEIMKGFDVAGMGKEISNYTCCRLIRLDNCRPRSRARRGQLQAPVRRQPLTTALYCKNASASIKQLI